MRAMSKKGIAFNVLIAIFALIALTIAATNFYSSSSNERYGLLSNQLLRAGFNSERLKNYLDRTVLIESNNLTFELAKLKQFEGCFVYRGNILWNQKSTQCFTAEKFASYYNKTLNQNLKPRYLDYPFLFFDIDYNFTMDKEILIGYPMNKVNIKNIVKSYEMITNELVEIPEQFTNVSGLKVSLELFIPFILLNYCDSEDTYMIHINPDDFKFYIVGAGEDYLELILKGNHTGVSFNVKELINECDLEDKINLKFDSGIIKMSLEK